MVKSIAFFTLTIVLLCGTTVAQAGNFGLGVIIGEPTGLSCKLWTGSNTALDGAVAWSLGEKDVLQVHGDFLFHKFNLFKVTRGSLPLYYGIGGRFVFNERNRSDDKTRVGIRFPIGIEYIFAKAPLDIFLELVPVLDLSPSTDFDLNGAIGIRFFF
ncbi:MAG: DUF3996 domain-containing protein [Candidatus Aminicenantes bacterium]|nr:DUF3996 domain-containing protein [Candidatus Aminicenantes bacterium]